MCVCVCVCVCGYVLKEWQLKRVTYQKSEKQCQKFRRVTFQNSDNSKKKFKRVTHQKSDRSEQKFNRVTPQKMHLTRTKMKTMMLTMIIIKRINSFLFSITHFYNSDNVSIKLLSLHILFYVYYVLLINNFSSFTLLISKDSKFK